MVLTRLLYEVSFTLTDPVLRLRRRKLKVQVALVTVFSMCSFQSSLLLMLIPSYLILSVIARGRPLRWYWCLTGLLDLVMWMVSHLLG